LTRNDGEIKKSDFSLIDKINAQTTQTGKMYADFFCRTVLSFDCWELFNSQTAPDGAVTQPSIQRAENPKSIAHHNLLRKQRNTKFYISTITKLILLFEIKKQILRVFFVPLPDFKYKF
jgi:hypothetical protein